MGRIKRYSWLIFIFCLSCILLFPVIRGRVPLPLDALTGSYYPWLDYKWGYSVGVPVKNASLSDVFSQLYVWRSHAVDQIRTGIFPLWNPHSYSGMPLLANWQSAVLYPLNLLMLVFGNLTGWTLLVFLQLLLSQVFMYLFLRTINRSKIACLTGSVIFCLSGYMMTNLEYVTVGHTFLWLPAGLLILNRYLTAGKTRYLLYLPFIIYLQTTAGAVYPLVYSCFIFGAYLIYLKLYDRYKLPLLRPILFLILGFFFSAIQIIPTAELAARSIRFTDPNIIEHGFGLLPLKYLSTLISPDIFGNPGTNNFRGFLGYQETSGYFSLTGLAVLIVSLPWLLRIKYGRFWTILAILFLGFGIRQSHLQPDI